MGTNNSLGVRERAWAMLVTFLLGNNWSLGAFEYDAIQDFIILRAHNPMTRVSVDIESKVSAEFSETRRRVAEAFPDKLAFFDECFPIRPLDRSPV